MSGVIEVRRHDGTSVRRDDALRGVLADIYTDAFGAEPYDEPPSRGAEWAQGPLLRHSAQPGFQLVTAVRRGEVLGFGYGLTGVDESWFASYVREHVPPEVSRTWLGGHGELVELAVRAGARGLGLGGRLHDAVVGHLADAGVRRMLLVTQTAATPARALYAGRGWRDLAELAEGSMLMGLRLESGPA